MTYTTEAKLLVGPGARLAECPRWHTTRSQLFWADLPAGTIYSTAPNGDTAIVAQAPGRIGSFDLLDHDHLRVAHDGGVVTHPLGVKTIARPDRVFTTNDEALNDGRLDPRGRYWVGTVPHDRTATGYLYRVDADGSIHRMADGIAMSNGIGWSPDYTTMFYVDSLSGGVDAFDYHLATGQIDNRRRFVDITDGLPDGLAVDDAGGVWVAVWGSSRIFRYSPDRRLTNTVVLPVPNVTACALADDRAYVTTAVDDHTALGGAVFEIALTSTTSPNITKRKELT